MNKHLYEDLNGLVCDFKVFPVKQVIYFVQAGGDLGVMSESHSSSLWVGMISCLWKGGSR